jgi:hypothetical protein
MIYTSPNLGDVLQIFNNLATNGYVSDKTQSALRITTKNTKDKIYKNITTGVRSGKPFAKRINGVLYVGRHSAEDEDIGSITGKTAHGLYNQVDVNGYEIGSNTPYSSFPEDGTRVISARKTLQKEVDKNLQIDARQIENFILK